MHLSTRHLKIRLGEAVIQTVWLDSIEIAVYCMTKIATPISLGQKASSTTLSAELAPASPRMAQAPRSLPSVPATLPTAPAVPVEAMTAVVPKFVACSGLVPAAVEPTGTETHDLANTHASAARFITPGVDKLETGGLGVFGPVQVKAARWGCVSNT